MRAPASLRTFWSLSSHDITGTLDKAGLGRTFASEKVGRFLASASKSNARTEFSAAGHCARVEAISLASSRESSC